MDLHKTCSFCNKRKLIANFKRNPVTCLHHSMCHSCILYHETKHTINRLHYYHPTTFKFKVVK
ncbi:hypothetical protein PQC40_gp058 [Escherichia phage EP335]|uniref:Uncharacterized protein n=1 Tax=Escherichia phage EP335 TaxID=2070199 RepID=A0A2Z3DNT2_9CAUD|nr:hypothetical protein PQC40_gp058 [Escherichia phage EP335]AVZ45141.1 hypothetical protein [Escherichia phage EP335]